MNETIKLKIKAKNNTYNKYIQSRRFESDFLLLEILLTELKINKLINTTKALYYENLSKKLNAALLKAKTYWSIMKTFYNEKKIPLIPPLLIDDRFVTDIKMKVCIFNKFFAEQCTPSENNSILSVNQIFLSQSQSSSLEFSKDKILKIIRALNIYKAHVIVMMISPLE